MTPEEYQPLNRLYDDVVALCDRCERRHAQAISHTADHMLNKAVLGSLKGIRARLMIYVEASAPFFSKQGPYKDAQGVLDDSAERAEYVQQLVNDLRHLSDRDMSRVSRSPGSMAHLSPIFAGTVNRERAEIQGIASRLSMILAQEQDAARQSRSSEVVVAFPLKHKAPSFAGAKPA